MKKVFLLLFFVLLHHLLYPQEYSNQLHSDSTFLKPDYRNHINIPEYNKTLMPLQKVSTSSGTWTELNPKVLRVTYVGIHFVNKDTGWAVGDLGALIKTTDGGSNWRVIETNTTTPILKVRSCNGQIVIASGYDGLILRSTDGGETFFQVTSGVGNGFDLWGLEIINDTLGWACSATSLLKTTDSGENWQLVNIPGYTGNFWWIDFMNEKYGFIAADGKVLRTTDGGTNWEIIQAGDSQPLYSIDVIDSLHIAAAGYGGTSYRGKNIYSSDGGVTWVNGGPLTFETVNCIQYVNPDTGYLVMTNVSARKTTNRGQEWTTIQGISDNYELQFFAEDNIGYSAGTGLKINKAEGNLDVWNRLIINDNFADVFFVNEQKGFAISGDLSVYKGLYKTTDGGINWVSVPGAPGGNDLFFLDSLTGFIGSNSSLIFKTTDGGINWYATNGITNIIAKIFFINSQIGWAAGGSRIFKTIDGGENWFEQLYNVVASFQSIYFIDSLYGWTANLDRPNKTTDGGHNWIQQTNLDIWESKDILFNDYLNGFILESNKLYKTTDGGTTFNLIPDITGFSVAGRFSSYSDSTIFIIGYKTYRSIDGGLSWFDFSELTGIRINGLNLLGMGLGYTVGELGLILKYYDETVPVELVNFTAKLEGNNVLLNWTTSTETNNLGFFIERKKEGEVTWLPLTFIKGAGTSTLTNYYSYNDELFNPGNYIYRLKQTDFNGQYEYSKEIKIEYFNSLYFYLSQNFPNPFNPSTIISYQLPVASNVTLKVYDVLGNEVATLVNEEKPEGIYKVEFRSEGLSSGIYLYKLQAGSFIKIKKMLLLK